MSDDSEFWTGFWLGVLLTATCGTIARAIVKVLLGDY